MTWQPISTAPKDGTRIVTLSWNDKRGKWDASSESYWWRADPPRWVFDGWSTKSQPEFWMPTPPKKAKA